MKKQIIVAILCCAVPLIIAGLFLASGGSFTDHSSMPQQSSDKKVFGTSIGNTFPTFSVIDVDGKPLNNETFKGKPTILWFTTTWCTPCQVGAKKVAELNKELGGALNMLVFFVDARESESDLRNWRNKYADVDWKLAFNNGLAEKIGIQYLDSKYLLDKDGIVRDFNTQIVNDQYLDLLRNIAKETK